MDFDYKPYITLLGRIVTKIPSSNGTWTIGEVKFITILLKTGLVHHKTATNSML